MALEPDVPGVTRANKPGNPKTQHDGLPWFGGAKIIDIPGDEIARQLLARGVAGVSHNNGREINLEAYALHLGNIGTAAANQRVSDWLAKTP